VCADPVWQRCSISGNSQSRCILGKSRRSVQLLGIPTTCLRACPLANSLEKACCSALPARDNPHGRIAAPAHEGSRASRRARRTSPGHLHAIFPRYPRARSPASMRSLQGPYRRVREASSGDSPGSNRSYGSVWQTRHQSPVGDQDCKQCRDGPEVDALVVLADRRRRVSVGDLVRVDHESEAHDVDRLCRLSGC
jgi:hypothetical protein